MSWFGTIGNFIGAGRNERRKVKPSGSESVQVPSLAAIFGEANPAQVSETPRPVGTYPAKGENIELQQSAVANGWMFQPRQVSGMSVLYVDSVQRIPDPSISGITNSSIRHSTYVPYNHITHAHWLYSRWDPIQRFTNTYMDVRFAAGHIAPLSNGEPGNIPGTAKMGPYAAPFRQAWLVPRFSTEPNTIIPQPGN